MSWEGQLEVWGREQMPLDIDAWCLLTTLAGAPPRRLVYNSAQVENRGGGQGCKK